MSYRNSDKEFYLSLYLLKYKEKLEQVLKVKLLGEIELEKNINSRKVDLYSTVEDGRELYMELQLSKADSNHMEQIFKIIENKDINNIILVWVATGFNKPTMLNEIGQKINSSHKNIYFVALKLNEKVIDYLHVLNNIFITEIIENLKILNEVENQFKVVGIFYRLQDERNAVCTKKHEEVLDLNRKEQVMKYLLKELRREISYYPSIHRDKKLDNNVITLAGGKAEINYYVGLNRRNQLYVEIRFGRMGKEIFETLLKKKEEVNDELDYLAQFDTEERRVGTYIYFANNKREILIKRLARITNKYIRCFTKYTFPNRTI